MIRDRRMQYVKSECGMDYYIFTPSFFRQYYNRSEEWTPHRKRLTHKLHMLLYQIRCGYRILYLMDGPDVAAYIIYTRAGRTVVQGSSRNDIFTVYVTTNPNYRRKGYASGLVDTMLHGIGLEYGKSYKTIADTNIGSQKAAAANGYEAVCPAKISGILHTISRSSHTGMKLYFVSQRGK